jgi:hypothetical protein
VKTDTRPVMVTTKYKGVFCGLVDATKRLEDYPRSEGGGYLVTLLEARMVVQWRALPGVGALAVTGPGDECRVSPAVQSWALDGCVSMAEVSDASFERWRLEPWA